MSVASVLAQGRTAALQLMLDTVTIRRATGGPTFDPTTGTETTPLGSIYSGPADVKAMTVSGGTAQAGEREITIRTYDIKLPFGTQPDGDTRFRLDDEVTVDACDDTSFVGLVLTVVDVQHGGRRTALHLVAEDRS